MEVPARAKAWIAEVRGSLEAPKKGFATRLFRDKSKTPDDDGLLAGYRLGDYTFGPMLGLGSAGAVFAATGVEETPLAIKVLAKPADEDSAILFEREATIGQKLHHPNIVRTFDTRENENACFVVMERICGPTLKGDFAQRWPVTKVRSVFAPLAEALAYAHSRGVVHRDLKPDNVMLTEDGGLKVLDFGLAQLQGSTEVTMTGQFKGTPMYTSPEQIKSSKHVTYACDQFSYGFMLFQALSGDYPYAFDPKQPMQTFFARLHEPARALDSVDPSYSAALSEVLGKMLSMEPEERFPSILTAYRAVDDLL